MKRTQTGLAHDVSHPLLSIAKPRSRTKGELSGPPIEHYPASSDLAGAAVSRGNRSVAYPVLAIYLSSMVHRIWKLRFVGPDLSIAAVEQTRQAAAAR